MKHPATESAHCTLGQLHTGIYIIGISVLTFLMVCVGCSRIEAFILSPCQDKLCIKCILSVAENCRKCPGCLKQIHSINSIDASDHCVSFTWSSLQWKVCLAPNDSVKVR